MIVLLYEFTTLSERENKYGRSKLPNHPGEEYAYGLQGKIRPTPFWRRHLVLMIAIITSVLMIVFASTTIALLARPSSPAPIGGIQVTLTQTITTQPTVTLTSLPSPIPTAVTSPDVTPTVTAPATTTPATPGFAPAKTISENIILKCGACSDPVVITVTKIVIEPSKNRMLWSLTFYNNSQADYTVGFSKFFLQDGDQTKDPTDSGATTYTPTGPGVDQGVPLPSGSTKQVVITFSFVPYEGIPYTLISRLGAAYFALDITFDPVVIQF